MKNLILAPVLLSLIMIACKKQYTEECNCIAPDPKISSEWHLTEILMDPGDGSGTFTPVTSNKNVVFYKDSTVASNGTLCYVSSNATDSTFGKYTPSKFLINGCGNTTEPVQQTYEIDGNTLIINYFCIEPCKEKYSRIMY